MFAIKIFEYILKSVCLESCLKFSGPPLLCYRQFCCCRFSVAHQISHFCYVSTSAACGDDLFSPLHGRQKVQQMQRFCALCLHGHRHDPRFFHGGRI